MFFNKKIKKKKSYFTVYILQRIYLSIIIKDKRPFEKKKLKFKKLIIYSYITYIVAFYEQV